MKLFAVVDNKNLHVNVSHPDFSNFYHQLGDYSPRLLKRMMPLMEIIVLSNMIDQVPADRQYYMLPRLAEFLAFYGKKGGDVNSLNTFIQYSNKNQSCDEFLADQAPQLYSRRCVVELETYCNATMPKAGLPVTDTVLKAMHREFKGVRKTAPIKDVLVKYGYLDEKYADDYFKTIYGKNLMRELKSIIDGESQTCRLAI